MEDISNTALTALFLQQSLLDSGEDFSRSIESATYPHWDCVIITASNELQAEGYRKQIDMRLKEKRLPESSQYIVVPDRDGKRVGSAGSTLSVIRELKQKYGDFKGKRFLCIHAGGDSKRVPTYSALGKLFSPVPTLTDGVPATLFDMFMQTMASVPGRLREGMLLLSGDVLLLFNPLMLDLGSGDNAAAISFKESVQTGKNHGVYLRSADGNVKKFLQKQSVEMLENIGAVNENGDVDIDTGAIALSPAILDKLYGLVDNDEKYDSLVNDKVRLSLYRDIVYCLAEDSTLEDFYKEAPEGEFCEELYKARKLLFETIGNYSAKLLCLSPSKFIHFGTTAEVMSLMNKGVEEYETLGWSRQINSSITGNTAGYNSVLSSKAKIGNNCYLECAYVHSGANIGNNCLLSFIDIHDETVPDNVVMHCLKQKNGKFVCRIYGVDDNPKNGYLFGKEISEISSLLGVDLGDNLWNAPLYPQCETVKEAIASSLELYKIIKCPESEAIKLLIEKWKNSARESLCSGFNNADSQAIIDWIKRMEKLVNMDKLAQFIKDGNPVKNVSSVLNPSKLTKIQQEWLEKEISKLNMSDLSDFAYAIRLYYYLGEALDDEKYTEKCFKLIANTVLENTISNLHYNDKLKIAENETVVKLPLRVNWGGGWTDTCPYCVENGGVVLNAAISLNGELPVEVRMVKIAEPKIIFDSRDMDVHGEFTEIEPLQKTGDPFDPFALQKACLLACGIIPKQGGNLREILTRLGGGFEMHSEVTNVPKGSGLGTSSILSAAAVKAVYGFTGAEYNDDDVYAAVLAIEQIMSTGGGWQDQVGGVTRGIKFITSSPGIEQQIKVEKVNISEETKKELNERFCIIYTGQRRLARNLLRDVVGRYIGSEPDSLTGHSEIQKTAALMRFYLERGDIDEFARLLDGHWKYSRMIDKGSSNTLIDQIFLSVDDLIDARMVCGAGGGGFLQVILKKGVTKDAVHKRLKEVFQDFSVDVWKSEILYD